jgi:hypothetical protein
MLVQTSKQLKSFNQEGETISASLKVIAGKANFKSTNSVTLNPTLRPLLGQANVFDVTESLRTFDRTIDGNKKSVTEFQLSIMPITNEVFANRILAELPLEAQVSFAPVGTVAATPSHDGKIGERILSLKGADLAAYNKAKADPANAAMSQAELLDIAGL